MKKLKTQFRTMQNQLESAEQDNDTGFVQAFGPFYDANVDKVSYSVTLDSGCRGYLNSSKGALLFYNNHDGRT